MSAVDKILGLGVGKGTSREVHIAIKQPFKESYAHDMLSEKSYY